MVAWKEKIRDLVEISDDISFLKEVALLNHLRAMRELSAKKIIEHGEESDLIDLFQRTNRKSFRRFLVKMIDEDKEFLGSLIYQDHGWEIKRHAVRKIGDSQIIGDYLLNRLEFFKEKRREEILSEHNEHYNHWQSLIKKIKVRRPLVTLRDFLKHEKNKVDIDGTVLKNEHNQILFWVTLRLEDIPNSVDLICS